MTCNKCGKDFEQVVELTPTEIAALAENKLMKTYPCRCPHCGGESETVLNPFGSVTASDQLKGLSLIGDPATVCGVSICNSTLGPLHRVNTVRPPR